MTESSHFAHPPAPLSWRPSLDPRAGDIEADIDELELKRPPGCNAGSGENFIDDTDSDIDADVEDSQDVSLAIDVPLLPPFDLSAAVLARGRRVPDDSGDSKSEPGLVLRVATLNVDQGLRAKLVRILQWALLAGVHVLALQETGDYAMDHSLLRHFGWHMIMSSNRSGGQRPRSGYAGVALLIRHDLNIRTIKELDGGDDGRLVGAVLRSPSGSNTLFVSAYLPTALDWAAELSSKADAARAVYSKILMWSREAGGGRGVANAQTVVLGDLNETLTTIDRETTVTAAPLSDETHRSPTTSRSPASARPRFITALTTAGFVDTYRSLHETPGFTCETKHRTGVSKSRIDYVLTHGFVAPAQARHVAAATVVEPPPKISRHRIVIVDLRHDMAAPDHLPPPRPPLPDMRRASRDEKDAMMVAMEGWVIENENRISCMASGSKEDVSLLGIEILDAALRATRCLPSSGGLRGRSKRRRAFSLRRRNLCSLRHLLLIFIKQHGGVIPWRAKREVSLHVARCRDDVKPALWGPIDVNAGGYDLGLWVAKLQKQINFIRREERRYDASLDGYVGDSCVHNPTAFVHRMQDGDQSQEVSAVVDPVSGQLATDPVEVARVFRDHYQRIFMCPSRDEAKKPAWIANLYATPKAGIKSEWYSGLMNCISTDDVKMALSSAKLICAPGQDRISSGIWRVMVQSPTVCSALASLLSGFVTHRFQPVAAKHAIIVPVGKKKNGAKTLDNFRPISLQCSLYKILPKVLATRLGAIFAAHPILHRAQDGFLQVVIQRPHPLYFWI